MSKVNFFIVTYDTLLDKTLDQLSEEELTHISCYTVQKKIKKNISNKVKSVINEWELPWNTFTYQKYQFYEYSIMPHFYKNQHLLKDTTHVGVAHYDTIFGKGCIKDIYEKLNIKNDIIFYQMERKKEQLSLSFYEISKLCQFMSERLDIFVDPQIPWNQGWISECMSVTPKDIFLKFGEFLFYHYNDIIDILKNNVWNIMNHCPHRVCGIVERMWGVYLMSLPYKKVPMNIIHDWNSYKHHHMQLNGTGVQTL